MKKQWFKRKRFGYGWTPSTAQGWAVLAVYIIILIIGGLFILKDAPEDELSIEVLYYFLFVGLVTFALFRLTMSKAPNAKWQWGYKDKTGKDEKSE